MCARAHQEEQDDGEGCDESDKSGVWRENHVLVCGLDISADGTRRGVRVIVVERFPAQNQNGQSQRCHESSSQAASSPSQTWRNTASVGCETRCLTGGSDSN